jgi:uncharacterized membrane protein YfcA
MTTILGLGPWTLAYALLVVLAGGFLKGYSGFGASMLWATALSMVLPPAEIVPMVLLFEVASSLQLLPGVRREVEWRSVGLLLVGAVIGTPIGAWALAALPPDPIRVVIALVALGGSIAIASGFAWKGRPGLAAILVVGIVFGLINGSTTVGGPPVVLFYFATPVGAAASRASIIAFFLMTDAYAAAWSAVNGLLSWQVLARTALFLPVMLVGVWLGARHFIQTSPESFKRFALILLMALGVALLLRTLLA